MYGRNIISFLSEPPCMNELECVVFRTSTHDMFTDGFWGFQAWCQILWLLEVEIPTRHVLLPIEKNSSHYEQQQVPGLLNVLAVLWPFARPNCFFQ